LKYCLGVFSDFLVNFDKGSKL